MLDCPAPVVDPSTNGTLAQGIMEYHAALQSCNDDKAALRFYFAGKLGPTSKGK